MLLIDVEYKVIAEYLMDLELGEKGYAYILNAKGNVVFHKDTRYFGNEDKKKELLYVCEFGQGYSKSTNTLVHKYTLENADWTLVGVSFLDEIKKLEEQLFRSIIIIRDIFREILNCRFSTYFP